ncbi:MAG: glycerol-3-phosphate 1-O-acyltransferase PlsY [Clostridiales bacterium]|nr:glycerol-3-phosphate 1-O-acyltransferase PlsY [Clostridiales bacterium]
MERIVCLVIGYVFGLFQTAYIYGRLHGIDIRNYGSGNAGTTNTMRVLGTRAGLLVLVGDILKCVLAVAAASLLFKNSRPDMIYLLKIYAAAGAILGHNFPFYLKFRGGKGIAATAGLILAFHPYLIPVGIVLFFGAFFITHYVSLGSLLVYAGFLIELIVLGQNGVFGMSQPLLNEMYVIAGLLTVMAYYKHRENIKRLLSGTERKTYLTHKSGDSKVEKEMEA